MRLLVIEDDPHVAAVLQRRLARDGFHVERTALGEDGIGLVRHYPFDLVLLDLELPDIAGQSVLRRIKLVDSRLPVLVLSGDDRTETRLRCFALGADDYVCKPCHGDELVARVRAIVRRTNGHVTPVLEIGDLRVDTRINQVHADGRPVPLTQREFQLVELLALRQGSTVTKDALLTYMYGGLEEPDAKIIDVYICKIRRKIEAVAPHLNARIETVWGRGYVLKAMHACPADRSARPTGVRPTQIA
jgi:two-component system, cell cycle response regulator CtrA